MVIGQLETCLNGHVAQFTETVSAGAPASAERAAAVVAMQKVLDGAKENHQHATAEFKAAQAAHSEATRVLQAAEAKHTAFSPEYTRIIGVRDDLVLELENFQNFNMLSFTMLRN